MIETAPSEAVNARSAALACAGSSWRSSSPFLGRAQRWALPFLCVLATTPEVSERLGKRHKTIAMWAHQMMRLVRRWLPDRPINLMGDTAYTVLELGLHAQAQRVALITTGRLDAVLHEPPPQRTQHT